MGAALVLVPEDVRVQKLFEYRMMLAVRGFTKSFNNFGAALSSAFKTMAEHISPIIEVFRRLALSVPASFRHVQYHVAGQYFGVTKVTSRQYRAYKRKCQRRVLYGL